MAGPTQPISEPLNGGLVTNRDPSTLLPGELTVANNAIYLPNDQGINKARGRTKYNTVAITGGPNVKGLRYLEFDGAAPILAAHADDDIHLSTFSDETGTFGTLTPISNIGSGNSLDAVHAENRYVLLIGAGQNTMILPDGTNRKQGLQPVLMDTTPTIGSGAWNTTLPTGFYHFFTTEVVKDGFGEIESTVSNDTSGNYSRTAATGLTSPATQSYTITRPTLVNTNATHWRVYMAGPTETAEPAPALIEFHLVGEASITAGTDVMTVGNGAFSGGRPPTAFSGGGSWTNPGNAQLNDNVGARCSVNGATVIYNTFGFSGLTGTITGFEVFIKARLPDYIPVTRNKPKITMDLTHNGTNFFPGNGSIYWNMAAYPGIVQGYVTTTFGQQHELWGRTGSPAWPLTDVNGNANFGIRITYGLASTEPLGSNPIVDIDFIQIVIHTTTGAASQLVNLEGKVFRTVVVNVAGITTAFGGDGPPPVASTGDIFEGQLVTNDIGDDSIIRYSLPDSIESFPFPYFLNFETKVQDTVTFIRRLGNKLIVGMKQGIYRVNYLPRESDAEFDRGRSYEAISESDGVVGPQAGALFSPEGGPMFLAYASHRGLRYTDGFQSRPLTKDIDWAGTVRLPTASGQVDYLQEAVVVDYPKLQQIWFYYIPTGATTKTKALVIHYSSMHQKEDGTFKVTGPVDVPTYSGCRGRLSGDDVLLTGQSAGFVFVEDRGYTHNAGGTIAFAVESREMYVAGPGRQFTVENVFVRHQADTTSTVTVTPKTRRGANALSTETAKTFTNTNGGIVKLPFNLASEAFRVRVSEPGTDGGAAVRVTDLVLEVSGHGLPEPRTT